MNGNNHKFKQDILPLQYNHQTMFEFQGRFSNNRKITKFNVYILSVIDLFKNFQTVKLVNSSETNRNLTTARKRNY